MECALLDVFQFSVANSFLLDVLVFNVPVPAKGNITRYLFNASFGELTSKHLKQDKSENETSKNENQKRTMLKETNMNKDNSEQGRSEKQQVRKINF